METVTDFIFLGSKITADIDCSHEIKRCLLLGRKATTNLDSILKKRHYFTNKRPSSQRYGFSSSHVWVWDLDHKESWVLKNWCFWTMVLEKTLESPLDYKKIKLVNDKRNRYWISIERTDAKAEAEAPILWPPDAKNRLIGKYPDAGKERLKAGGEGNDRGKDGWMVSQIWWTWVWAGSRRWWWTGKPGMLQSMELQRVGHDWATELNWNIRNGSLERLGYLFKITS